MKKFFKKIQKQSKNYNVQNEGASGSSGGATGGTEVGYELREKDLPKLHKAAWTGDLSKVVQLVKKDTSSLDKENRTALHLACVKGHSDIVKVLLEWHAKSNIGDSQSRTPLLKAVECGQEQCVLLLLEHNADVDATDRDGNSGLHLAVKYNHPKIVKMLIKGGANVNVKQKTSEGLAPLHLSVQLKRDEISRILLIEKANPDIQDSQGRTPLMLACFEGSITPVRMLLQFNANTVIKDKKGFTAEDMANMTGQYASAQLLSDHALKLRRSTNSSIASTPRGAGTPRGSVGVSSSTTTPRDPSLTNMLPAEDAPHGDSDEETTPSRMSHGGGDDSWADDSISFSLDNKKKAGDEGSDFGTDLFEEADDGMPKISLAAALPKFSRSDSEADEEAKDNEELEDDVPPYKIPNRQQQSSVKSNQSNTSVEDIPYDEEDEDDGNEDGEQQNKKGMTTNRVSFREESDIKEITEDETDVDEEDEDEDTGSGPKKQRLSTQEESGYLPTGMTSISPAQIDTEKHKAFMEDLGIEDEGDSDPEISEMSDQPPLPDSQPPQSSIVFPGKAGTEVDNVDSEWDSTQQSVTPRPGILKNWKQHSQEEATKNKKNLTPRSDGSEWDSDIEDDLNPQNELVDKRVEEKYMATHFSDNDDGLRISDSEDSEIVEKPKRVEVCRDGSLRGIGDSPIVLDYNPSGSDDSPLQTTRNEVNTEIENQVIAFTTGTIEEESPRVDIHIEDDLQENFETEKESTRVVKQMDTKVHKNNTNFSEEIDEEMSDDPETDQEVARVLAGKVTDTPKSITKEKLISKSTAKQLSPDVVNNVPSDEEVDSFNLVVFEHISSQSQTSQWDTTTDDGVTPRGPNINYFSENISSGKSRVMEVREDDSDDEELPVPDGDIQKVAAPVTDVKKDVEEPVKEVKNQTVMMLNETKSNEEEEDSDSNWDSDEDLLPSETAPVPVYLPENKMSPQSKADHPLSKGDHSVSKGDHSISEDVEEESISEWEIDRQREKERKEKERKMEEEAQQLQWEEEQRQALEEQKRLEEIEREAELERQQAELARQQEWEEEERLRQEKLRREAEEEQIREAEISNMDIEAEVEQNERPWSPESPTSPDSSSSQKRSIKSPDTPPTVRLNTTAPNLVDTFEQDTSVKKPETVSPKEEEVVEEIVEPVKEEFIEATTSFTAEATNSVNVEKKSSFNVQTTSESKVTEGTTSFNSASPKLLSRVTQQLYNGYEKDTDIHGGQKGRVDGPAFDQNLSIGVTSFNRSPAASQRKPSPHLANTSPANMHSDGMSVEDDDSIDLDYERPADMGTYLRGLPGHSYGYSYKGLDMPDDDVLSYTSTENGDSLIYQSNMPYGKDVLANMNLADPGTVLKLQEHMHDQNKRLDHERNTRMALDNKYRSLAKEKNELTKKVENLSHTRSSLEQIKLDLEQKIRNLEYNLSEEGEMRKNAETLLSKTKEQLSRKEEQFTIEIEAKQKTELQMRNLQIDLRTASNSIKQLEEEKSDLQRQLQNEKNARQLQEQFNEDQQKMQQAIHEEQIKSEVQKEFDMNDDDDDSEAENKLEAVDEDRKTATDLLRKLRAENAAIKLELEKQRTRHRDEVSMLSVENEELQSKIDELKNDIKLNEEALSHATVQYNLQMSNLKTENSVINSVMEKEKSSREKLEAELESLKTRLHTNMLELDKAQQARNDIERRLQHDKEDWSGRIDNKEKEVISLKDNTQVLLHRLNTLENKITALDHEVQGKSTTLVEKNNLINKLQTDVDFHKNAYERGEENAKNDKEQISKLQLKNETLSEKVSNLNHELLTVRQQLETAQHNLLQKSGENKTEQFTTILSSMKSENEKNRLYWEERNNTLSDQCTRLKDENRTLESRRAQLEQDNARLNNEIADNIRKISLVEANYMNLEQTKRIIEEDKTRQQVELEKLREKCNHEREKSIEAQSKYQQVQDQLRRVQEKDESTTQRLLNSSVNMEAVSKSKEEAEELYQNVKLENAKLEAEIKHERQRVEMLQKDLNDSQKVRSSLEALCANLKSTNSHLEDKLGEESTTKYLITQEAEENKELWEKEVISRSKLGLRISQYEKQKQDAFNQLEEERRKHRKALESKRTVEMKLEAEIEKNTQLQKEVASLKAYLKVAKKRLKGLDSQDSRINSLSADFDRERLTMESTISSVRQQLQSLQSQLEHEVEEKEKLHSKNLQLLNELSGLKRLEKTCKKLEQSKDKTESELREYKNKVETGFVEKEDLERVRRELEARYRLELNRKLEDVNNYLEEQARARERLDTSRDETEYKMRDERKKMQEDNASLRLKYEQALAEKESREMEVKRYKDLYESEMQWRMRLSNQLMQTSDKAFNYKSKLVIERQKNRSLNTLGNLTFSGTLNGQLLDSSRISGVADDLFQSKLKAELDRSINKHLEAAPHDKVKPVITLQGDSLLNSSLAKSNADYLEVLQRKYCV